LASIYIITAVKSFKRNRQEFINKVKWPGTILGTSESRLEYNRLVLHSSYIQHIYLLLLLFAFHECMGQIAGMVGGARNAAREEKALSH
jgi:hypothetical protein